MEILLGILLVLVLALIFLALRPLPKNNSAEQMQQVQQTVLDQLARMRQELQSGQQLNVQTMQRQFQQSQEIIRDVTVKLTQIDQTNKQVLDFSGQLQSLENILKNPKQRGILGEYFLETLLGNVLQPNQYRMQYKFANGETVDAAIFYRELVIPIDAKFSLEKYNKIMAEQNPAVREQLERDFRSDVKNRIDETAKYIRPPEGTTEFAFMFIPAEGVYYNLLIYNVGSVNVSKQDLIEYAFRKHVIIVSPTSFFAYLETVLQGLKAAAVQENIQEIIGRVGDLQKHLNNYEEFMRRLGKNLAVTVGSYNTASKELQKIDKDIYRLTDGAHGGQTDLPLLDRPNEE
ncbi:MAG: DNA recombination protein RmuC [Candidatus Margulisbacteria bacterium]|jgi:DNA recombination protein RmuC|nr:DNA recombination protein RmuC [Candidatus Margulisiibacteriota bacterium]